MNAHIMNVAATEAMRCREWIENALEYSGGTHDFKDILDGILSSRYQLWPATRGCMVTEVVQFPKKKALHVFLAGGELDQILDMEKSLIQFSKAEGCDMMTLAGRAGWKRVLSDLNWKPTHTVLAKEL